MAGKSTLLRPSGSNAVLARAGGPVCAASAPDAELRGLVERADPGFAGRGVSLYMAELLRLKQIVDAARAGPILYLLDEILHGTNTTERRIAARSVIRQLVQTGSIGAVSTHDLELVDGGLPVRAVLVHLVDEVVDGPNGPEMVFDYRYGRAWRRPRTRSGCSIWLDWEMRGQGPGHRNRLGAGPTSGLDSA